MTKVQQFLASKETEQKLMAHLEQQCPGILKRAEEPNTILAGGAIANTLIDLWRGQKPRPAKDIDVFIHDHPDLKTQQLNGIDGTCGSDVSEHQINSLEKIHATHQKTEGKLDLVACEVTHENGRKRPPTVPELIEYFDLNCCQAAWTPKEHIVCDEDFEEFLEKQTIKINCRYNLNANTLVRLISKAQELNVPTNRKELQLLITTGSTEEDDINKDFQISSATAHSTWALHNTKVSEGSLKKLTPSVIDTLKGLVKFVHYKDGIQIIGIEPIPGSIKRFQNTNFLEKQEIIDPINKKLRETYNKGWQKEEPTYTAEELLLTKEDGISGLHLATATLQLDTALQTLKNHFPDRTSYEDEMEARLLNANPRRPASNILQLAAKTHQLDAVLKHCGEIAGISTAIHSKPILSEIIENGTLYQIKEILSKDTLLKVLKEHRTSPINGRPNYADQLRQVAKTEIETNPKTIEKLIMEAGVDRPLQALEWVATATPQTRKDKNVLKAIIQTGIIVAAEQLFDNKEEYKRLIKENAPKELSENLGICSNHKRPENLVYIYEPDELLEEKTMIKFMESGNHISLIATAIKYHADAGKTLADPAKAFQNIINTIEISEKNRMEAGYNQGLLAKITIDYIPPNLINPTQAKTIAKLIPDRVVAAQWLTEVCNARLLAQTNTH